MDRAKEYVKKNSLVRKLTERSRTDESKEPQETQNNNADPDEDLEILSDFEGVDNTHGHKKTQNSEILVMKPDSPIRASWDLTLFVFIVYQAIVLPFKICFEVPTG